MPSPPNIESPTWRCGEPCASAKPHHALRSFSRPCGGWSSSVPRASLQPAWRQPCWLPAWRPLSRPAWLQSASPPAWQRPCERPAWPQPSSPPAWQRPCGRPASRGLPGGSLAQRPAWPRPSSPPASRRPCGQPAWRRPSGQQPCERPASPPASRLPARFAAALCAAGSGGRLRRPPSWLPAWPRSASLPASSPRLASWRRPALRGPLLPGSSSYASLTTETILQPPPRRGAWSNRLSRTCQATCHLGS